MDGYVDGDLVWAVAGFNGIEDQLLESRSVWRSTLPPLTC